MPAQEAPVKPAVARPRVTVPVPPKTVSAPPLPLPPLTGDHARDMVAEDDARQIAALGGGPDPGPPELPPSQTPQDLETEVELRLHSQLQFISYYQPGTMTVNEFAQGNGFPETGRRVLDQFIASGWVEESWRDHYGRYTLTQAGLDHLAALTTKYNL